MKRTVKLCGACIYELSEYWPYVESRDEIIIEEVEVEECDNYCDEEGVFVNIEGK